MILATKLYNSLQTEKHFLHFISIIRADSYDSCSFFSYLCKQNDELPR